MGSIYIICIYTADSLKGNIIFKTIDKYLTSSFFSFFFFFNNFKDQRSFFFLFFVLFCFLFCFFFFVFFAVCFFKSNSFSPGYLFSHIDFIIFTTVVEDSFKTV